MATAPHPAPKPEPPKPPPPQPKPEEDRREVARKSEKGLTPYPEDQEGTDTDTPYPDEHYDTPNEYSPETVADEQRKRSDAEALGPAAQQRREREAKEREAKDRPGEERREERREERAAAPAKR